MERIGRFLIVVARDGTRHALSATAVHAICEDADGTTTSDQLERLGLLMVTYVALHELFADGMADRWVRLANRGPLFAGRTPIQLMQEDGVPGIRLVLQHARALRQGF